MGLERQLSRRKQEQCCSREDPGVVPSTPNCTQLPVTQLQGIQCLLLNSNSTAHTWYTYRKAGTYT